MPCDLAVSSYARMRRASTLFNSSSRQKYARFFISLLREYADNLPLVASLLFSLILLQFWPAARWRTLMHSRIAAIHAPIVRDIDDDFQRRRQPPHFIRARFKCA